MKPTPSKPPLKVGLVSLWWPPVFAGGELYAYRLARGLKDAGVDIRAITASGRGPSGTNGVFEIVRAASAPAPKAPDKTRFMAWFRGPPFARWCRAVYAWAGRERFTHILVNIPGPVLKPELFRALRKTGARVGMIHHEPPQLIGEHVHTLYARTGNWDEAAEIAERKFRGEARRLGRSAFDARYDTRLAVRPDFVVSASHWSNRFIDFHDPVPKRVLHPRMGEVESKGKIGRLPRVDVGVINPLLKKGGLQVANVILHNRHDWRFRVLAGGWGREFPFFRTMIREALVPGMSRVDIQEFIPDIRTFFRSVEVFMFPSRQEGYGMAPIEALEANTPVVSTDYPAMHEGVGSAALMVPFLANGSEWVSALRLVLDKPALWAQRGAARLEVLRKREPVELDQLIQFLARDVPPL